MTDIKQNSPTTRKNLGKYSSIKRADVEGLESDLLNFQTQYLTNNSKENRIEENWEPLRKPSQNRLKTMSSLEYLDHGQLPRGCLGNWERRLGKVKVAQ